uniref:Uncharacterized protein n=1 Tax=Anguilla anguilla TaxID=7936 RepID=A0A0E9UVV9_ANGAN
MKILKCMLVMQREAMKACFVMEMFAFWII